MTFVDRLREVADWLNPDGDEVPAWAPATKGDIRLVWEYLAVETEATTAALLEIRRAIDGAAVAPDPASGA